MDAYEIQEGRFLQQVSSSSVANALSVSIGPVPENKVWTILSAFLTCSVAEVQDFWFSILAFGPHYPITIPFSFSLDPATSKYLPLVTEGMEVKIFQRESLTAFRDAATAGSTISLFARIIEADLPLYEYTEPQERKRISNLRSSVLRRASAGGGMISPPRVSGGPPGPRGGGRTEGT